MVALAAAVTVTEVPMIVAVTVVLESAVVKFDEVACPYRVFTVLEAVRSFGVERKKMPNIQRGFFRVTLFNFHSNSRFLARLFLTEEQTLTEGLSASERTKIYSTHPLQVKLLGQNGPYLSERRSGLP